MQYLNEGTLVEDYVLDNISRLMGCLRECNTSIKWVMLHTAPGRCGQERKGFKMWVSTDRDPLPIM